MPAIVPAVSVKVRVSIPVIELSSITILPDIVRVLPIPKVLVVVAAPVIVVSPAKAMVVPVAVMLPVESTAKVVVAPQMRA